MSIIPACKSLYARVLLSKTESENLPKAVLHPLRETDNVAASELVAFPDIDRAESTSKYQPVVKKDASIAS
jgi:hypothetical protein